MFKIVAKAETGNFKKNGAPTKAFNKRAEAVGIFNSRAGKTNKR